MNDIHIQIADWLQDQQQLMAVRTQVFVREQSVPAELEMDEHDVECTHVKAFSKDSRVIATARLLNNYSIGRMCVLKEYRNKGVGKKMLNFLIDLALQKEFPFVHLNAQLSAATFYQQFGFKQDSEVFVEAGIDHVHMIHSLAK